MFNIINSPYFRQQINDNNKISRITKNYDLLTINIFRLYKQYISYTARFNNSNSIIRYDINFNNKMQITSIKIGFNMYILDPIYSIDITFDEHMHTIVQRHSNIPILITSNTMVRKKWHNFNSASVKIDNMNNVKQIYIFKYLNFRYRALFENNNINKMYYKNNYKTWKEIFLYKTN